ncbi:unknown protein [Seminavis robusta]|uniref:Uncharacterized protein n=1 Tax=Seminavis robusta TaxID=568900 RepID=A0A9N8EQU6_9STRA|nr:unknown protein [Seminavis robusta]|eukprot:Sro1700_g292090.1 n/a (150) ;mRNA; f:2210-2659
MAAMEDTRKKVGGKCWAQAERVSKECKRIFGAALSDTWLEGIVIKVDQRLSNPSAKRATTYITALYKLGERDGIAIEKEKELTMQSLKAANPKAPTENNNNNNNNDDPVIGLFLPTHHPMTTTEKKSPGLLPRVLVLVLVLVLAQPLVK